MSLVLSFAFSFLQLVWVWQDWGLGTLTAIRKLIHEHDSKEDQLRLKREAQAPKVRTTRSPRLFLRRNFVRVP